MTTRYRITPRAQSDLRQISRHTKSKWGKAQRDVYLGKLRKRVEWLADNPYSGRHRQDIEDNLFSFPEGEHVIFYKRGDEVIDIVGVIHNRMDAPGRLGGH
jgi:toxin ParE1/3/4